MCASALIFLHGANDLGLNSTVGLSFVFSLGSHDFIALNWYPPTLKGGLLVWCGIIRNFPWIVW